MNHQLPNSRLILLVLSATSLLRADVLELKNGTILNGDFAGGTATTVRITTNTGVQVIPTDTIVALTFTSTKAATAPAAAGAAGAAGAAAASPAPPPPTGPVTVPAGTTLVVSMLDPVSSNDPAGSIFRAKLQLDLAVGNVIVAPAGTVVHGKVQASEQARRARGKSELEIKLSELNLGGRSIPITTENFKEAGSSSVAKVAKTAAAGAVIGAMAGDAGQGAAIGAGVGVLRKGKDITITPGTLLEFDLTQPLTVQPSQ